MGGVGSGIKGHVTFSYDKYTGSHGRKPKGRGNWAIGVHRKVHFMGGNQTLAMAKRTFKIKMKRLGHRKNIVAHILP